MNPLWSRIPRIRVILDNWSWSRSPQRNAPINSCLTRRRYLSSPITQEGKVLPSSVQCSLSRFPYYCTYSLYYSSLQVEVYGVQPRLMPPLTRWRTEGSILYLDRNTRVAPGPVFAMQGFHSASSLLSGITHLSDEWSKFPNDMIQSFNISFSVAVLRCPPRSLGSWFIKGNDESVTRVDSSVPLMNNNPDDHKGTHPILRGILDVVNLRREQFLKITLYFSDFEKKRNCKVVVLQGNPSWRLFKSKIWHYYLWQPGW